MKNTLILLLIASLLVITDVVQGDRPYAFVKPDQSFLRQQQQQSQFQRRQGMPMEEESRNSDANWYNDDEENRNSFQRPFTSVNESSSYPSLPRPQRRTQYKKQKSQNSALRNHRLKNKFYDDDSEYYDDDEEELGFESNSAHPLGYAPQLMSRSRGKNQQEIRRRTGSANNPVAERRRGGYRSRKGSNNNDDEYYDDYEYGSEDYQTQDRDGGYGHSGGGYSGGLNPLALLVAPLAAISLLSAAAAVALNPVLVSISVTGRKKRSAENDIMNSGFFTPDMQEKLEEMKLLENYLEKNHQNDTSQHRLLSMYLSCSGFTESNNLCLDRVVCEYSSPDTPLNKEEKDVISMRLFDTISIRLIILFLFFGIGTSLSFFPRQGRDSGYDTGYSSSGHSGYGGGGGGSSGYGDTGLNPLAAFIAPLAALALLSAAAAVSANPVLIQLGVIGKKRKRSIDDYDEMNSLTEFLNKNPEDHFSLYLKHSGLLENSNQCLELMSCRQQIGDPLIENFNDIIPIIVSKILNNPYISQEFKNRLKESREKKSNCHDHYQCMAF